MNRLFSLEGRTALVTGGSSGIGRMIASGFIAAGARVYIASHQQGPLEATAEVMSLPDRPCVALVADLSTADGCRQLSGELAARETSLDILVNNAGTSNAAPLDSFSEEMWDSVLDLNLKGPFFLTQALLPLLRAAARPDRPAKVINIASVNGLRVWVGDGYAYHASKAGLIHLTRKMASRLVAEHICVTAIAPGAFPSVLNVMARDEPERLVRNIPAGRLGRDEDIQGLAVYLASEAGDYQVGTTIPLDGGLTAGRADP